MYKTTKVLTRVFTATAIGSVVGAGIYLGAIRTLPEKWNNTLTAFRKVHVGFDGTDMIAYLATGEYEDGNDNPQLVRWQEREVEKTIYIENVQTKEVTKYHFTDDNKQKSLVEVLPGKTGDKFNIYVESRGYSFDNKAVREEAESKYPEEMKSFLWARENKDPKKDIDEDKINDFRKNFDDNAVLKFKNQAAAQLEIMYFDSETTLAGVTADVETPGYKFIKPLDYKTFSNATDKSSELIEDEVKIMYHPEWVNQNGGTITLNAIKIEAPVVPAGFEFGQLRERLVAPNTAADKYIKIPRAMADVSPDTQLIGHDIDVVTKNGTKHLGHLGRYNNELVLSDAKDLYNTESEKNADAQKYGDIVITSWW